MKGLDLSRVRRRAIAALISDDELGEQLHLKGGNALALVHKLDLRTSLDLDFSLEGEWEELGEMRTRIERVLVREFRADEQHVFDVTLIAKPKRARDPKWGGYCLEFKVATEQIRAAAGGDHTKLRRSALVVNPPGTKFKIDISKLEHCEGADKIEFEGYTLHVYSKAMIAAEKLRALCQQMEAYEATSKRKARARDVFDICQLEDDGIDLRKHTELLANIFAQKDVPLSFLDNLAEERELHRSDWASIQMTLGGDPGPYDDHFDRLLAIVERLQDAWDD